jgi:hypothetical protein
MEGPLGGYVGRDKQRPVLPSVMRGEPGSHPPAHSLTGQSAARIIREVTDPAHPVIVTHWLAASKHQAARP